METSIDDIKQKSSSGGLLWMSRDDDIMERVIGNWAQLGHAVREERRARHLTQSELASIAHVSRGWLVRFEQGLDNAEPTTVFRVLNALNLSFALRTQARTEEETLLKEVLDG